MNKRVLLIDNDLQALEDNKRLLAEAGYEVFSASSISESLIILKKEPVQLIVTELRLQSQADEEDISGLAIASDIYPPIPKIVLTTHPSYRIVRRALSGENNLPPAAIDFLAKEEDFNALKKAVDQAFDLYIISRLPKFQVAGALTESEKFLFIPRNTENQIVHGLLRMDYLHIIEPRQQGKTTLLNFLPHYPELAKYVFVYIDISSLRFDLSEKEWYNEFTKLVFERVELAFPSKTIPIELAGRVNWLAFFSSLARFFAQNKRKLVIALDEIGVEIPNSNYFFSAIRAVYGARQQHGYLKEITFMLVGAFSLNDLIRDPKISPFNISRRIRLHDFTLAQVTQLIERVFTVHGYKQYISERVFYWTAGQPYLTQLLCSYLDLNSTEIDVDEAVDRLRREDTNHLPPIIKRFHKEQRWQSYIVRILAGQCDKFYPAENLLQAELELIGLLKASPTGDCMIRNRIYEIVLKAYVECPDNIFPSKTLNLSKLHIKLVDAFSKDEFSTLCFNLGLPYGYDELLGDGIEGKCRELIQYFNRRESLGVLIEECQKLRPGLNWIED